MADGAHSSPGVELIGARRGAAAGGRLRVCMMGAFSNAAELRAGLADAVGDSDADLAAGYIAAHGHDALLTRAEGSFSLAACDQVRGLLVVAADRFASRPVYVAQNPGEAAAGANLTETAARLGLRTVEPGVLPIYLHHGFVPAPFTPLRGVAKLAPATVTVIERHENELRSRTYAYWAPPFTTGRRFRPGARAEVEALLKKEVARVAGRNAGFRIFPDRGPAAAWLRAVAGAEPVDAVPSNAEAQTMDSLRAFLASRGEPTASSAAFRAYEGRPEIPAGATVLTPAGGDTLLGLDGVMRSAMLGAVLEHAIGSKWSHRLGRLAETSARRQSVGLLSDAAMRRCVFHPAAFHRSLTRRHGAIRPIEKAWSVELGVYLPPRLQAFTGVALAPDVRFAAPFASRSVVEYCLGLAPAWFAVGVRPRRSRADRGERDVLAGEIGKRARTALLEERTLARGWFRPEALRSLLAAPGAPTDRLIRSLLVWELWCRLAVDGERAPAAAGLEAA